MDLTTPLSYIAVSGISRRTEPPIQTKSADIRRRNYLCSWTQPHTLTANFITFKVFIVPAGNYPGTDQVCPCPRWNVSSVWRVSSQPHGYRYSSRCAAIGKRALHAVSRIGWPLPNSIYPWHRRNRRLTDAYQMGARLIVYPSILRGDSSNSPVLTD